MSTYQITAVMPSLNEEKNLEAAVRNVVASFERFGIRGEIVGSYRVAGPRIVFSTVRSQTI